jgi:hypothetical protein
MTLKPITIPHLSEDEIVVALVDPADLAPSRQSHLHHCPRCEAARRRLEQGLARFVERVDQWTPSPLGPASFPDRPIRSHGIGWNWAWKGITAAAAAALVIMVVNLWPQPPTIGPLYPSGVPEKGPVETERLIGQVNALVENALPPAYMALTGGNGSLLDDEFMDFLVPPVAQEVSHFDQRRGHVPC